MKENIWQALINKEESLSVVAKTRLKHVLGQHERITEKKQYLDDILTEYSQKLEAGITVKGEENSLSISTYMLQIFKIKENLQAEEQELSALISKKREVLARHSNEIYKYSKLKSVAVKNRLAAEVKLESRHQDESNVVKYNIDRHFNR